MAGKDDKVNDPFHSGHTQMFDPDQDDPSPQPPAPQQASGGQYVKGDFSAHTMALPLESLDGYDSGGPEGMPGPASASGPPENHGGQTMALAPPSPSGPASSNAAPNAYTAPLPPVQATHNTPPAASSSPQSYAPQQEEVSSSGTPYLKTEALDMADIDNAMGGSAAQPQGDTNQPQSGGGNAGGGIPYLETQAIDPSQFDIPAPAAPADPEILDEPVATTMLDSSKYASAAPVSYAPPSLPSPNLAPQAPPVQAPPVQAPPAQPPPPADTAPAQEALAEGPNTVILQPEQAMAIAQQHQQQAPALQPVAPTLSGKLVIFVPDTAPIIFELLPGITTVGRGMENHLVLGDPYASRKHLFIVVKSGQYSFEDSGSDNGTLVNGQTCSAKMLQTGDVIEIGSVMMRFVQGQVQPQHQQVPTITEPSNSTTFAGPIDSATKKKQYSKPQLALLVFLILATLGLVSVMVVLILQRIGNG